MTRREIFEAVACPSCGAPKSIPCSGGKLCPRRRGLAEMLHGWRDPGPTERQRAEAHERRWRATRRRRK